MIPDMRRLLERIRSEKEEKDWLNNRVIGVQECQKAIDSACKKLASPALLITIYVTCLRRAALKVAWIFQPFPAGLVIKMAARWR